MVVLMDLWWPVLLAAVLVFVASSVLHMVLPLHRKDYRKLTDEESVLGALRAQNVTPGQYMLPCAGSLKEAGSPEMLEKFRRGPVAIVTILPSGPPAIGKNLALWFAHSIVVGVFVAYLASLGLPAGADASAVFRHTATTAFLAYGVAAAVDSIWKGVRWSTTAKFVLDGFLYGLATGAAFAWLWPAA